MSYVDENLESGETIVARGKTSRLTVLPPLILLILCAIITLFIAKRKAADVLTFIGFIIVFVLVTVSIVDLVKAVFTNVNTVLAVTDKRVIGKAGVFSVRTLDTRIDKVDDVSYKANLFGKIFRYYDLKITSTDNSEIWFKGIANAPEFKNKINETIEKHAEETRKNQARESALAMQMKGEKAE